MPTPQQSDQGFAYQPVQLPDVVKRPQESPFQGQGAPQIGGSVTHGGAVAGIFDSLLRGAVNGLAMGQQHKALTLKKTQDDLNTSYNMDAQRAHEYAQEKIATDGKLDPSDPEFQKLKSAVDGSWGALQQFRGQLLEQQMGGKKKGGKKGGEQQSPMQVMMDPKATPQEKAAAAFAVSNKLGAPVYGQIQALAARAASPQAQQQRTTEQAQAQVQGVTVQNQLNQQQLIQQRGKILAVPEGQRTAAQQAELKSIDEQLTGPAKPGVEKPGDESKRALDAIMEKLEHDPEYKLTDADKSVFAANKVKVPGDTKDGKFQVTKTGEILWLGADGKFESLRPSQGVYEPHGRSEPKPKTATMGEISTLTKETSDAYKKAHEGYEADIAAIDVPPKKGEKPRTEEEENRLRQEAATRLENENHRIGALNSQRMRDLGLIPAEDSARQGGQPQTTHPDKSKGVVRKAAFLHENPGATDADWEAMKPGLKAQGYEVKD